MFRPDVLAIFRESSVSYAAFMSIRVLEFSQMIKLLLCLQFLNSNLYLNSVTYSEITIKYN